MTSYGARTSVAGVSAPEAIVALLLGLFVLHLGLGTVARLRTVENRLALRRDGLTAMRVANYVLRTELRRGRYGSDWVAEGDSITLRAFRGTGLVCPTDTAAAEITVSFSGMRRPDPSKDSVLLMTATGGREVRALVDVAPAASACGPVAPDSLERWTLDAPASMPAVVARLFERGSYHAALAALRYRRGSSGRQPLTPEVWNDDTFWTDAGGRLRLEVHHESEPGTDWVAFVAWTDGP